MKCKAKRIVFLISNYYEQCVGGAEYQSYLIAKEALRLGCEVHYIFISNRTQFTKFLDINLHPILKMKFLRRLGIDKIFYFNQIWRSLRKIKPTLIYQRGGSALTGIAAKFAKKYGIKMIWHISTDNELISKKYSGNIKQLVSSFNRLLLDYGIKNADIVIAQTQKQGSLLKQHFGRECNAIIPNGHPVPILKNKKPENVQVLWVANIKPLKQPEYFVELTKSIGNMANVTFTMVGRYGSPKRYERLLAEIDEIPNLKYIGEIPNDEVNKLLSEAHVLVNTSLYEGFSNTFIQAWMRKVPVVSLNVDPDGILVRERIGFHSKTVEQLLCDVKRLIENKTLREEMGKRARNYAIDNLSLDKMFKKVMVLFDESTSLGGTKTV